MVDSCKTRNNDPRGARVAHIRWQQLFHPRARCFRLLAIGHPLASFFPGLDVCHYDHPCLPSQSLGLFHWIVRRGPLGLHQYFRNHFPLQRSAGAVPMDSLRTPGPAGSADCHTRVAFQFSCGRRVLVGLLAGTGKAPHRPGKIFPQLCTDQQAFSRSIWCCSNHATSGSFPGCYTRVCPEFACR